MGDISTEKTLNIAYMRGVTLVELLTVMAIISIVLGAPMITMVHERKQATVEEGQATVLQAFETSRSRAISGAGGVDISGHVVCVREDSVELFTKTACPGDCASCTGGEVHPLPPGVTADEARVEFSRLQGESNATTIDVSGFGNTKSVTVTNHGLIQ